MHEIINFQGCQASGATVHGKHVCGYLKPLPNGRAALTTGAGQTMLVARCETVATYTNIHGDRSHAILFCLPKGRFLGGHALGDNGDLFRGELLDATTDTEARYDAQQIAEHWFQRDAEHDEQALADDESDD